VECRDVHNLLHPFVDGELDLVRHLQIEHHLADCSSCADRERGLRQLREVLAAPELRHRAPDALRGRLQATPSEPATTPASTRPARRTQRVLLATAAGIVLVVASVAAGAFLARAGNEDDKLSEQVTAAHIRSLQVAHATDVASSDRHTVKPWFLGKLDFAPQVPDLSAAGFALSGGRMDYLVDRPVAALVYRRRDHVINVFTWSVETDVGGAVRSFRRQGFQIRCWQHGGMAYWAVSDLNDRELDEFVRLFQEHVGPSR
jgi:anti-sigma factor RsiW